MQTSLFIISFKNIYPEFLNFKVITLASLIPLGFAIWSYLKKSEDRITATGLINKNLSSLFIFAFIVNSYFIFIITFNSTNVLN